MLIRTQILNIYTCEYDGEFTLNADEVAELRPFNSEEIVSMLKTDQSIHPELKCVLTKFPELINNNARQFRSEENA